MIDKKRVVDSSWTSVEQAAELAVDEVLEALWTETERGVARRESVAAVAHVELTERLLGELKTRALVVESSDGSLRFTERGRERAKTIIRRHRLAERLVRDIMDVPMDEMEANACEFEHLVAPGITESICTLLGHPSLCPHGRSIPEGRCCREARKSVGSALVTADRMDIGEVARIAYIKTETHSRLLKLGAFGISPGVQVKLQQRRPALVLELEQTQVALEEGLAKDIYVLREG